MSNEAVDINGEEYKKVTDDFTANLHHTICYLLYKVRISSDNILKSKLVLVKISKVGIQLYIVPADWDTG